MNITNVISLFGGLAFFLFGMFMMGKGLKRVAGNQMQRILGRLASTRLKGILLGAFVTAIIQSSSATSVMVVSFVNSGIMGLKQAISVIMGACIGTTATGWILTLAGLSGDSTLGALLSTEVIFAIVAVIGVVLYMAGKTSSKRNVGVVLVSLSVLMTGMRAMSGAMEPLQTSETFLHAMTVISNPILCIILGIGITALIQSCSASIGILQALSMTGVVSFRAAIPMVIGMSIGACLPVLISAIGANKDAKRAAFSYLYFNIFGGVIFMVAFAIAGSTAWGKGFYDSTADSMGIAIYNTAYKALSVVFLYPFIPQLEKLVRLSFKDAPVPTAAIVLDDMLLNYPAQAIEQGGKVITRMAEIAVENMNEAIALLTAFDRRRYEMLLIRENEEDEFEDKLSEFLVRLNAKKLELNETRQTAKFLRCMTDLERISDHSENIARLALEMHNSGLSFSPSAAAELSVCTSAIKEILNLSFEALVNHNVDAAYHVEPLEEVVDALTEDLKQRHIERLQQSICSLKTGFIFNDCINNFERTADHCSNIAISVIELYDQNAVETHDYLRSLKQGDMEYFKEYLQEFEEKYAKLLKEAEGIPALALQQSLFA